MRVIIAGSRDLELSLGSLSQVIKESGFEIDTVVCGMARGVDMCGRLWGTRMNKIVDEYPADWTTHGKSAGFKRNVEMSKHADGLIAIMKPGGSRGTQHMIDIALVKGLKVFVKEWK
jgi:hypothetical protein